MDKQKVIRWLKNILQYEDLTYGGTRTINDVITEIESIEQHVDNNDIKPEFNAAKFNFKCPSCGGCYETPLIDILAYTTGTCQRCPFCGREHLGSNI